MKKQHVIVEDTGKIMGPNWEYWRLGISEITSGLPIKDREFKNNEDQRAYEFMQKMFAQPISKNIESQEPPPANFQFEGKFYETHESIKMCESCCFMGSTDCKNIPYSCSGFIFKEIDPVFIF